MKKYILIITKQAEETNLFTRFVETLRKSYNCMYADSALQAMALLKYIKPEALLIDDALQGHDKAGLTLLKTRPEFANKACLYFTVSSDEVIYCQVTGNERRRIDDNSIARLFGTA